MKNAIGIIGGMGPMASQLFYKMVIEHTQAHKDQDHIDMILLNDASMPDRTEAILSGDYEKPLHQLLEDAKMLERCGCKAIGITCNTSHYFVDMMKDQLNIPIIHMIRETAAYTAGLCPGELVGIMATDGTVRTGLYQKAVIEQGLRPFIPSPDIQKEVMYQIYDRIKNGKNCDLVRWKKIEEAYQSAGCKKVLLACTELSVIKADENLGDWYVDSMEVLTKKVIEFAGKTYC
ncbi:MAG: amino acid racemase [Lachnospiraceae bacterium]|nr:amino acid racemase [Lachnospiraceae bacterium]